MAVGGRARAGGVGVGVAGWAHGDIAGVMRLWMRLWMVEVCNASVHSGQ